MAPASAFNHFPSTHFLLQPSNNTLLNNFSSFPRLSRIVSPFRFFSVTASDNPRPSGGRQAMNHSANRARTTSPKRSKPKSSHGTSRRSALKKTFTQEQVSFANRVPDDPVVGIIGGGMSGLVCALYLDKRGIRSTVFDSGVHGLGGRMGTRIIDPQSLIFDHAAQFFTVNDPSFSELVNDWSNRGLVEQWHGTIGELQKGGRFTPFPSSSPPRYIGVNGMRPLADSILSQTSLVKVVRPCWISALDPYNGTWHLSENGKSCGHFDAVVIAHNGKCANRLLASSGLPIIARQMKRLKLSSIWALLATFEDSLPIANADFASFEGAFVKGVDSVSWMANNTKKLSGFKTVGPHCWTILSSAAFGMQNKVPQESIPTDTAVKVKEAMLEGVEKALGLPPRSLKSPFYTRLQLWGAALPTNTPSIPCIFDPYGRAGVCGDWLLGSSLEAAALSGMALANHIADYLQSGGERPEGFAAGLHNEFESINGHDIGQFPHLEPNGHIENSFVPL
ncbi:unnamed protein product [Cuscuta europaea]|uniref:FAD/NAD(P)-binding oxidoreductase family protein n=1 Tax=Cuscuta europaea TaxID=41803 RepID=A0A9P0Z2Q3_CUSEU|nr:unnamed protein product [Cuscuta europaea]